jgi:branched-chain amino acid transport system substrate-binding protein
MMKLTRVLLLSLATILGVSLLSAMLLLLPAQAVNARASYLINPEKAPILEAANVITIGVAGPLSGPNDEYGWPQVNSVQLAINQVNAAGGVEVGGTAYPLLMVAADDQGDPSLAPAAANALLDAGVVVVVGHSFSGASMAAQPVYNAAGVTMISPSSTNPAVTQQGYTTTFRTIPNDAAPINLFARYMRWWKNYQKAALVESPNSPLGSGSGDLFISTFVSLGGTITGRHFVNNPADYDAVLTAIQAEDPDFIFFNETDPNIAGGFSLAAFNHSLPEVPLGWNPWDPDEARLSVYASAAGAAAEGDYASMPYTRISEMPGLTAYTAAYQAANFANYPDDPTYFGVYAYDIVSIIADAIERANSLDPADIRDQIAATQNYNGAVGTYQGFDEHGDVIPQSAWLEEYHNGEWLVLHPTQIYLPMIRR